jgi:excisionase family DNA binding protein
MQSEVETKRGGGSMTMTGKILYSRQEAAELLSLSLRSVVMLIDRGELPVRRIGRRVLVPRASLEAFARRDHKMQPRTADDDRGH